MSASDTQTLHARRYIRSTLGWTLLIYALLLLALLRPGLWPVLMAIPLVYVRLALGLHELLHLCPAERVPEFHRWALIFDTPLGLGYRELRIVHYQHHRWGGSERDPEYFQIAGSHGRALGRAMLVPELTFAAWVRLHGLSGVQLVRLIVRSTLFVLVAALNPVIFAVYWLLLRLSIGVSSFIFHHLLHARGGQLGTFALPAPQILLQLGRALFGKEPIDILTRHREHHLWPRLRVWELPELPRDFNLPPGLLSQTLIGQAHAAAQRSPLP